MTGNAFVYGTLMAEEVLRVLIKRVPTMKPATLHGFTRYRVKGQCFPAIIPTTSDCQVLGKVLMDLSTPELEVLDNYEDVEYYRQTVQPLLESSERVSADVYVWKDEFRGQLETREWSYEEWREEHIHTWLQQLGDTGVHPTAQE